MRPIAGIAASMKVPKKMSSTCISSPEVDRKEKGGTVRCGGGEKTKLWASL